MVPVATWADGDGSCARLLRANPRLGWNGIALSPQVGCPRASVVDKPRLRQAWKRPPLVLPGRRLRRSLAKGARSRQSAGRRATPESQHWTAEFSLRDPDGYYVTISALNAT